MTVPTSPNPRLLSASVAIAKIGSIANPFPSAGGFFSSTFMMGAVINGDAVFFSDLVVSNINNPHPFYAFRIQPVTCNYGEYLYWPPNEPVQSAPYRIILGGYGCQQVGPNTLQVFDVGTGSVLQFNIPIQPVYGARTNIANSLPSIPSPCGQGTIVASFYDTSQNLVAYEWQKSFALDYFDYAAIYKYGINGEQIINGGFVGMPLQGGQAFNQTSASLPAGIIGGTARTYEPNYAMYSNGWTTYCTLGDGDPYDIGGYKTTIVQGGLALNCNTNVPNNETYVTTTGAFNFTSAQLEAMSGWTCASEASSNIGYPTCYCEVPGLFITTVNIEPTRSPGFILYSSDLIVQCEFTGSPAGLISLVLMANGVLMGIIPNGGNGWDVYQGFFDITQYKFFFPQLTFRAQSTLVNYARPISVNGSYLT